MVTEIRRVVSEQYPYFYIRKYTYYNKGREIAKEILDREGKVIQLTGAIPDGPVVEYYPNRQIKGDWNYYRGKPDGLARVFYQSGQVLKLINYRHGKKEGTCREYYASGKVKSECVYRGDKLDGIARHFDAVGNLVLKMQYKNGVLEAGVDNRHVRLKGEVMRTVTVEYPDGRANEITYLIDGEEIAWEYLDSQGNRQQLEGKIPDGIVKEYYPNGRLLGRYFYLGGKLEGIAKTYYKSGNLKTEIRFKNGKREGPVRVYYESGTLQAEANFKNGVLLESHKYAE